ncbi:MAG: zeta toxin family protein, partial [Myxococcota bacterium]
MAKSVDDQSPESRDPKGESRSRAGGVEAAQRKKSARGGEKRALVVEASGLTRPYMRGIMVHSLTARGVSFDDAYATAQAVSDRIRNRPTIERKELGDMVHEILGDAFDQGKSIPVPIDVVGDRGHRPFSKGTLSQSLLAAALEPDDAFGVARAIETALIRQGRRRVTQVDLRRFAHAELLDRFGPQAAERYLVWRQYQEPHKPVIILIGGTAGVGKTSVALSVAQRLDVSRVLSTDSIRHVMRIMLSTDLMPALHLSSFEAHQAIPVRPDTEDPLIDGFMTQASTVTVGARAIIDRAIEENTNLVLDGVSLVPGGIDLEEYADRAHLFFLLLARLDEEAFRLHFEQRAKRQRNRGAERYVAKLDDILMIQEHLLDLADRFDV